MRRWSYIAKQWQLGAKGRPQASLCASALCMLTAVSGLAQSNPDPRGMAVSAVNETPAFLVRVEVDHPDRLYREGDAIQVSVRSERAGYLYLFYCDASRSLSCLYPNQVQSDNYIPENQSIIVPDVRARFRLRVGPPFGNEVLKAIVTTQPLQALEVETLIKGSLTALAPRQLKAVFVEVAGQSNTDSGADPPAAPRQWAEHHVEVTTVGSGNEVGPRPNLDQLPQLERLVSPSGRPAATPVEQPDAADRPRQPKRVGVFIGIGRYQDPGIRPLRVADRDARTICEVLKQAGKLNETVVLENEKATLGNIRRVIRDGLPVATRPGDLVILYWSGHGGRTSNLDGSEPDGYDEYLVPYDGCLEPADKIRTSMLLDKTFGRWVQELDGRRLLVIINACHSGGQTRGALKALSGDSSTPFRKFFFATNWRRTKDIGQRETAVLASSRTTQVSFEGRSGNLSVMTHFLIDKLRSHTGPLTLKESVEYLETVVPAFVEQHYPGTTQTPVFVSQMTAPVYLRP